MINRAVIFAALLPLCFTATGWGEPFPGSGGTRSVLGDQRDEYFSILESSPPSSVSVEPPSISTENVYDLLVPTTTAAGQAGDELLRFLERRQPLSYSRDRWLKMRRSVVEGIKDQEPQGVISSTDTATPEAPELPPGLAVELPYESQLFISGRKLIGVSLKSTMYDHPEANRRVNSSSFDMAQELQVRIKGRVGRKINVNVDFDDTRDDKRDISVMYKGDPDEIVQEAAFGDIAMSLPSTEFMGYSRQLFGVKVDTKYKDLRTQGFFSRTKGFSEVKRFSGNTRFERRLIQDNSYITLKYYSLFVPGEIPPSLKPGFVEVWQDDANDINNNDLQPRTYTPLRGGPPYTGYFDRLVPGQDYIIDYQTGVLTFRNKVPSNYTIAVKYDSSDETSPPVIIKDKDDTPSITTELKTFYSLGNVKIMRDNGRGNFLLRIQDLNESEPSVLQISTAVPTYPSGLKVDFENGIFYFDPITLPSAAPFPNSLYDGTNNHQYNFLTEYRYRVKIFNLRPGVVPQSERVTMDGRLLKNNDDYFIDYDAGIVTLFKEDLITESTVIDISYDYAPFGSTGGSTLIGMRSDLSLTQNIFIGGSFIYDFAAKTQAVPDIRTTPASLAVGEIDAKVQDIRIPGTALKMTLSGEVAQSQQNPNIMGKAIVESMEGIKQEDSASLYYESWRYGANPSSPPEDARYFSSAVNWNNSDINKVEISTSLTTDRDEKQQILNVNYDFQTSTQVSIVQSLSESGLDYSRKEFLEMWVRGDDSGHHFAIQYGTFNEDADGDLHPDTEDVNSDGTLNAGEDIGWKFNEPDGTTVTMIGKGNGRLDSEDLNGNGRQDTFDNSAGIYGARDDLKITWTGDYEVAYSSIGWQNWKYFKIPLKITDRENWRNIRQVRLTVRKNPAVVTPTGTISFAKISTTGNRWEPFGAVIGQSSVTLSAINNEDPAYASKSLLSDPRYNDLYGDDDDGTPTTQKREQALSIKYAADPADPSPDADVGAKLVYTGRPYDLSNYNNLKLFVYNKELQTGDTFYIQAGGNDSNYYEYALPVNWTGWKLITIRQTGQTARADHWVIDPADFSVHTTTKIGSPSLQNISQLKIGVRSNSTQEREIWVNEIHVTESRGKTGTAWKASADFSLPGQGRFGALNFGMGRKEVGRDFETFSAGVYNRDYLDDSGYMDFKGMDVGGITLMPFNARLNRTRTLTPSVVQNQNDLLSVLDEGRVTTYQGSFGTSLNLKGWLPDLSGQYTRGIIDSQQIQRLEDRETISGLMNYQNPLRFAVLPTSLSANYSLTNSYFRVYPENRIIDSDGFLDLATANKYLSIKDYHTLEISEAWGMKAPFTPWEGFNFSPSYSINRVREKNRDFTRPIEYPKSLSQDIAANSTLRVFSWLQPSFNYAINTRENYNLMMSTMSVPPVIPSQTKFIERSSNGEINLRFQVKDVTSARSLQSLNFNSSYRFQDSDSYDNVESSFSAIGASFDRLWIRDNLMKSLSPGATTPHVVKSIVNRDDIRIAGSYNPLEALSMPGRLAALKTLTANFTYTGNDEHSYITGTQRDIYTRVWPDLIFGIRQWEKLFGVDTWVADTQMNLRHQKKTVETVAVSFSENRIYGADWRFLFKKKYDVSFALTTSRNEEQDLIRQIVSGRGENLSWSTQGGFTHGAWRFNLRYENGQDWQRDASGKLTRQLLTDAYTGQVNSDMSFPRGFPLPFTRRTLPLTNRFIFNSSVKYVTHRSSLNVERDNNTNYGLSSTGEYEVSQNFRLSMGLGWNRFSFKDNPNENYTTIEATSRLTIQF